MKTDVQLKERFASFSRLSNMMGSVTHMFEEYGDLLDVKVLRDWQGRPFAFCQYHTVIDAKHALVEAHDRILDGRHVRVEQARVNRTLFFAKYDKSLPDQVVHSILEEYGPIEDVSLLQNYSTGTTC